MILNYFIQLLFNLLSNIILFFLHFFDLNDILFGHNASPYFLKIKYCALYYKKKISYIPEDSNSTIYNLIIYILTKIFSYGIALNPKCNYHPIYDGKGKGNMPVMPYYITNYGGFFDSKQIIRYWDNENLLPNPYSIIKKNYKKFITPTYFLISLFEFYFDEWWQCAGGYHQRWYNSKDISSITVTNSIFENFISKLIFSKNIINHEKKKKKFIDRQLSRLEYHLSYDKISRELLDGSFKNTLKALEKIYEKQSFLLGDKISLADISLFGWMKAQNIFNLKCEKDYKELSPNLYKCWQNFDSNPNLFNENISEYYISTNILQDFMNEIIQTLLPLQYYNLKEFAKLIKNNHKYFNEFGQKKFTCFIKNKSITYFVKSFQAKAWLNIKNNWRNLSTNGQKIVLNCISTDLDSKNIELFLKYIH